MLVDADAWDQRYDGRDYVWTVTVNRFVEAELAELTAGTAIDLGAGEGRNAVWLAQQGWAVTAVDFSAVGLDKARRLAGDHGVELTTVVADATAWEPSQPVDLVLVAYLQLPPDARRTVLDHTRRWLRPGGRVVVIAHDRSNVADGYGGPPDPDVCYTVEETVAALDGLRVERGEVVRRPVDTEHGERVALDTLVVAVRPAP